jgi:hypothetical protein
MLEAKDSLHTLFHLYLQDITDIDHCMMANLGDGGIRTVGQPYPGPRGMSVSLFYLALLHPRGNHPASIEHPRVYENCNFV